MIMHAICRRLGPSLWPATRLKRHAWVRWGKVGGGKKRVRSGGFEVDSGVDSRWIAGGLRWIQVDSRGFGWVKGRRE